MFLSAARLAEAALLSPSIFSVPCFSAPRTFSIQFCEFPALSSDCRHLVTCFKSLSPALSFLGLGKDLYVTKSSSETECARVWGQRGWAADKWPSGGNCLGLASSADPVCSGSGPRTRVQLASRSAVCQVSTLHRPRGACSLFPYMPAVLGVQSDSPSMCRSFAADSLLR